MRARDQHIASLVETIKDLRNQLDEKSSSLKQSEEEHKKLSLQLEAKQSILESKEKEIQSLLHQVTSTEDSKATALLAHEGTLEIPPTIDFA
jgi:uncharacterized protein involved in exopolysaccharide biosynthesis